ncbi:hypothetical protein [Halobacteriovorax sp. ZH2_bin.1]|uniref:hypothetical protein n=1 Tax=unclassified Halobacteriovorax TaxID=2639665 RepID=UPI00371A4D22
MKKLFLRKITPLAISCIVASCGIIKEDKENKGSDTIKGVSSQKPASSRDSDLDGIKDDIDSTPLEFSSLNLNADSVKFTVSNEWNSDNEFSYKYNCSGDELLNVETSTLINRVMSEVYGRESEKQVELPSKVGLMTVCKHEKTNGLIEINNAEYLKAEGIKIKGRGKLRFNVPKGIEEVSNITFSLGKYDSKSSSFSELSSFTLLDNLAEIKKISLDPSSDGVVTVDLIHAEQLFDIREDKTSLEFENGLYLSLKDYSYKVAGKSYQYLMQNEHAKASTLRIDLITDDNRVAIRTTESSKKSLRSLLALSNEAQPKVVNERVVGLLGLENTSLSFGDNLKIDINNANKGMFYALGFTNELSSSLSFGEDNKFVFLRNIQLLGMGNNENEFKLNDVLNYTTEIPLGSVVDISLSLKKKTPYLENYTINSKKEECYLGGPRDDRELICRDVPCSYTHQRVRNSVSKLVNLEEYLEHFRVFVNDYEIPLTMIQTRLNLETSAIDLRLVLDENIAPPGVLKSYNTLSVMPKSNSISFKRVKVKGSCNEDDQGVIFQTEQDTLIMSGAVKFNSSEL